MRGQSSKVGDTMLNQNGYHHTRTEDGWVATHRIIAEKNLGRKLKPGERVTFQDGDKTNLDPDNIVINTTKTGSLRRRKAALEARIEELQGEIAEIDRQLIGQFGSA